MLTTAAAGGGRILRRVDVALDDGKPRFDDPQDLASGSVRRPTWSPDGTRIAYRGGKRLYVVDRDGGQRGHGAGRTGRWCIPGLGHPLTTEPTAPRASVHVPALQGAGAGNPQSCRDGEQREQRPPDERLGGHQRQVRER